MKSDLEQSELISPTLSNGQLEIHDYETGVEVRSLLPTERLEELGGRLAVTDEDPNDSGVRYVKFWVDEVPINPEGSRSHADEEPTSLLASARDVSRAPMRPEGRERMSLEHEPSGRNRSRGSPDFGRGAGYQEDDTYQRG